MPTVAVLGAGISGLAAARRLRATGHDVVVLEASARPGGVMRTETIGDCRFELGPNTVQRSPELVALCRDAGILDRLISPADEARKRYVMRRGALVPVPGSPPALLGTPLFTPLGKLRLLGEPLVGRGPGPEESLADFARRRLGRQAVPLVDAVAHGVYAGDPAELATGHAFPRIHALETDHGSLLRGLLTGRRRRGTGDSGRPTLAGYRGGFAALARDLCHDLDLRTETQAIDIERHDASGGRTRYRVSARSVADPGADPGSDAGTDRVEIEVDRIVSALPSEVSRVVLRRLGDLDIVETLPHAGVATVNLVYDRDRVGHPLDGFGFLVPHHEGLPILGCLFVSSLFADSAPPDRVALTVMIGGRRNPGLVDLEDTALVETAIESLRGPLAIRDAPLATFVNRWRPGIPQPTATWPAIQAAADAIEDANPGLSILGAWRAGPGVPNCIAAGWRLDGSDAA